MTQMRFIFWTVTIIATLSLAFWSSQPNRQAHAHQIIDSSTEITFQTAVTAVPAIQPKAATWDIQMTRETDAMKQVFVTPFGRYSPPDEISLNMSGQAEIASLTSTRYEDRSALSQHHFGW